MGAEAELLLNVGFTFVLLVIAYFIGGSIERRHYRLIREREDRLRDYPVLTFETLPADWRANRAELVTGSVVVSLDYFKRIIAGLRSLIGGRIKTYEPLLDRARREAVLRMTEEAQRLGYDAVINVRLETSRLANARSNGQGIAGVEMLAFGTAIKLD